MKICLKNVMQSLHLQRHQNKRIFHDSWNRWTHNPTAILQRYPRVCARTQSLHWQIQTTVWGSPEEDVRPTKRENMRIQPTPFQVYRFSPVEDYSQGAMLAFISKSCRSLSSLPTSHHVGWGWSVTFSVRSSRGPRGMAGWRGLVTPAVHV